MKTNTKIRVNIIDSDNMKRKTVAVQMIPFKEYKWDKESYMEELFGECLNTIQEDPKKYIKLSEYAGAEFSLSKYGYQCEVIGEAAECSRCGLHVELTMSRVDIEDNIMK